ncbi:MAG: DUF86 domain-containing protein [bacterium]|nr:DUF86 domain-containing protein [bacterium]
MTNFNAIELKISSIRKYLKILKSFKKYSQKEMETNDMIKGAVERYLYLAIQETIGLAEAVVSLKDFRRPEDYGETFEILNEENIISPLLREKMVKMTGFRNIVAHDYKKLDFTIVYDVLQNRLKDIEDFIKQIKKSLNL